MVNQQEQDRFYNLMEEVRENLNDIKASTTKANCVALKDLSFSDKHYDCVMALMRIEVITNYALEHLSAWERGQ